MNAVAAALARYAAGAFPMDDDAGAAEVPWYVAPQRAVFALDPAARAALARRLRRSTRACAGWPLRVDTAFDAVLDLCAEPPPGDEGVWITERLKALYRELHAAGFAHSFELWTPDDDLAAGILAVIIGRAALLESMRRTRPHAGNALLTATLDLLASHGATLCDIQLPTAHTVRLGAVLLDQPDYEARLAVALATPPPP